MVNHKGLILERHNQLIGYSGYMNPSLQMVTERELPKQRPSFLFECHLSVDERYFVMHDEVFDIVEQKALGYLWDSIDTFKTIFGNVQIDNTEYKEIQEGVAKLPLMENKSDLYAIRDVLIEWTWAGVGDSIVGGVKDAGNWAKDTVVDSGKAIAKFATDSWDGLKKMGIAISKGDWGEIMSLLGRGVLFILRKLKDAAYSTLGMIVDAILIATGIGKGAQMVAWGLITALDVYQIVNNDWPDGDDREQVWKYLDLGFDVLGLVFAGVAAKGARAIFRPLQGLKGTKLASKIAKSPKLKALIKKIHTASKSAAGKLKGVATKIKTKWPTGFKWIGSILGGLGRVIKKLQTYCGKLIKTSNLKGVKNMKKVSGGVVRKTGMDAVKTGTKAAAVVGGLSYGIEKGIEAYTGMSKKDTENMSTTMDTYNDIYGDKDPFDTWD